MKYENINILGNYSLRDGGTIYFSMRNNMELGTEVNTYIHELFHMYLTNFSNLGFLLLLLEKESDLAIEAQDETHNNKVRELFNVIFNRTVDVQEVYANNQELLWIEENISTEMKDSTFDIKTKKYQDYCNKLINITNDPNLRYQEKRYWIDRICFFALDVDIFSSEFLYALESKQKLSKFFSANNHPNVRLDKALMQYTMKAFEYKSVSININQLLTKLKSISILKYFNQLLPELEDLVSKFENKGQFDETKLKQFIQNNQERMDEKIRLFDIQEIKVLRVDNIYEYIDFGVFVINDCENIITENNIYCITETTIESTPTYVGSETSLEILSNSEINVIGISSHEFDLEKMEPKYIKSVSIPIVVLIDNYTYAKEAIKNIRDKGELYIGDLYNECVNNFFTMMFFRERTKPNIIYIFPTLKRLAVMLTKELGINFSLVYSNANDFKKIISIFEKEIEMLKFVKWVFNFVMKSSFKFTGLDDPAAKLSFDLTKNIISDAMEFKYDRHYSMMAAIPTKATVGEPYYALMEFEGGKNTGILKANDRRTIIFFKNREDSLKYKYRFINSPADSKLESVGIDRFYLNELKKRYLKGEMNIFICLNPMTDVGCLIDLHKLV